MHTYTYIRHVSNSILGTRISETISEMVMGKKMDELGQSCVFTCLIIWSSENSEIPSMPEIFENCFSGFVFLGIRH